MSGTDRETTLRERLAASLAAIYIGNLNTVEADLDLPAEGEGGISFRWESSEERFITKEGAVHRPLFGMGNRKVTLTVTATLEGVEEVRTFEATVLQQKRQTIVSEIRPVEMTAEPGSLVHLPSVVIVRCEDGRTTTLPVAWETGQQLEEAGSLVAPEQEGTYEFTGKAEGAAQPAKAVLRVVDPQEEARRKGERWNPFTREPMHTGGRGEGPVRQLFYYPISDVRLLPDTPFYKAQQRMNRWLLAQDTGQLLYAFRKASGLSTGEASPMTGWDAEDCKLRGHTTGHYLSGVSLAYAATGDVRFRKKAEELTAGLAACQDAFAATGTVAKGFLSAYSEEQFDLLEKLTRYPEIWAPYYTLDKIMSGLYDAYTLADCEQAFTVLQKLGDWVYRRLARLSKEKLDAMWAMYIAGEFGGMLGTMVRLYRLSGKADHLLAARLFTNEKLFYPMEQNIDTLEDMHANQHIPQILGAMDLYETTGEGACWRIASHFWEMVTKGHTYCIGGTGETEMFHGAHQLRAYITEKAAESCASYNMLRLTGLLFPYIPEGRLMDYYENTLLNHIMASASHAADGGTTYFMPLLPGGRKEFSTTENTCCHGTGLESRYRYMEHIYAWDEEVVYVNLPVDSELRSDGAHLTLETQPDGRIILQNKRNLPKDILIHIPAWAQEAMQTEMDRRVLVNGAPGTGCRMEKGYLRVPGGFVAGDNIILRLPADFRVVPEADDPALCHVERGPWILAELSEETAYRPAPEAAELGETAGKRRMIPLCQVDQEAYHVYFTARR